LISRQPADPKRANQRADQRANQRANQKIGPPYRPRRTIKSGSAIYPV
jgi:hypothetical protein